jgi:hypothetical protein
MCFSFSYRWGASPFNSLYFETLSMNERGSAVNRALDGSTYSGLKLVSHSICQKSLLKMQQFLLGIGNAI